MIRWLFLLHRYLGIGVGALMVMWCLSGVVMMYVSYPVLPEQDRALRLAPIDWRRCCKISDEALADGESVGDISIEMLAGRPVMELRGGSPSRLIDLTTGEALGRINANEAASMASSLVGHDLHGTQRINSGAPQLLGLIHDDQWTLSGGLDAQRPLYRFAVNDGAGTEVYVSSTTGRVVQITTARQRFWNWLGAVPHWLYFAELRRHTLLWADIVIGTSLAGCFLAGTGLYIGVRQFLRRPRNRWSPYQGFNLWHHLVGVIFGVLTLTWVVSGLLSMNPWGWLEGGDAREERALLRGGPNPTGAQLRAAIQALANATAKEKSLRVVSVRSATLGGRLSFLTTAAGGERRRVAADGLAAPLRGTDLADLARNLGGGGEAVVSQLIENEDDYYFGHHRDLAPLPVYRIALLESGTRYYLDPVSGELLAKIAGGARAYRWLHEGLHRMDFTAAMRRRPQWDVLMLVLMSGVTVVCVTGAYLGYRRPGRRGR